MSGWISLLERAERLTLTNGAKQLAEIRVVEDGGRWMFAVSCHQHTGDFWGFGEPLGYERGSMPTTLMLANPDRSEQ